MMEVHGQHLAGAALFKQCSEGLFISLFFIYLIFSAKTHAATPFQRLCWDEHGLCWFLSKCGAPQPSLLDSFEVSGLQSCVKPPISHLTWVSHEKGLEATTQCQTSLDRASSPACCWEGVREEGKISQPTAKSPSWALSHTWKVPALPAGFLSWLSQEPAAPSCCRVAKLPENELKKEGFLKKKMKPSPKATANCCKQTSPLGPSRSGSGTQLVAIIRGVLTAPSPACERDLLSPEPCLWDVCQKHP